MEIEKDFEELLVLFGARFVESVIVGAHALAFHGSPRYTGALDVFVRPTPGNARRILAALRDFGFGSLDLREADFEAPDRVIQLGDPPLRIDLVTSLTGVSWEEVRATSVEMVYGNATVQMIGREALVRNKRATGRHKDLADLEALGET